MKKLNEPQITAKCVEISKCLLNTEVGLVDYDLAATRSIGDAARLAVSIKQLQEPVSVNLMAAVAAALKIPFRYVQFELLPLYEQLGWGEIKRSGSRMEGFREQIPPTEDILTVLGEKWRERNPTPIDEGSILSLSELSKRPFAKDALISELGIKDKEFEAMFDYGDQARYLGKYQSEKDGADVIWTPLYWASNVDTVKKFLAKQDDTKLMTIGDLAEKFRKNPGLPIEATDPDLLGVVNSGISSGFYPSVRIKNRQGATHEYLFAAAPQFEADPKQDVFEKARLIVSCIRHGQYHAEITKILYPRSILRAMRNSTMKPHPYADIQYFLLATHGIVKLVQDSTRHGKAWRVLWIDTPENNLAADIAEQLLHGEEVYSATREEIEASRILVQGYYNYTSEQRRVKTSRVIRAKSEYERMMELMAGVRR